MYYYSIAFIIAISIAHLIDSYKVDDLSHRKQKRNTSDILSGISKLNDHYEKRNIKSEKSIAYLTVDSHAKSHSKKLDSEKNKIPGIRPEVYYAKSGAKRNSVDLSKVVAADEFSISKMISKKRSKRIPYKSRRQSKLHVGIKFRKHHHLRRRTKNTQHTRSPAPSKLLRAPRAVTVKRDRTWDYGVIPYEIDYSQFDISDKALFNKAMRHWENFTCIKFVERSPEIHPNFIYFTVETCGCCSFVGKRGTGRQTVSIGPKCEEFGIVVHELGHAIGFWHEHARIDRDKHILINRTNIMKGQEYNFDLLTIDDVDMENLSPYDYNSIMHYGNRTFSKNPFLNTILPLGMIDNEQIEIGQRNKLSRGDITQANLLYKCPACGKTFQQDSGRIVSPHYDINLGEGIVEDLAGDEGSGEETEFYEKFIERCEWSIMTTYGQSIILRVHHLNLSKSANCEHDYLVVRDGYWHKSPIIKKMCGDVTAQIFQADSGRMLISYMNHNVVRGLRGFYADFEVTCGGEIFLTDKRRIDSPNHPLEYPVDKECVWIIRVPENHQVALQFQSFEMEKHDICIYDYVEVRDGNRSDSERIGFFCGYNLPPDIRSNSSQMYIKFTSDSSVQKHGFSAVVKPDIDECRLPNHGCEHKCINTIGSYVCECFVGNELQANGKTCEVTPDACGGIIDASISNGTLESPSYPGVYPILKKCIWEIVAPANYSVFLNFTHFDLEAIKNKHAECNDYLSIYSKSHKNRLKQIGVFCGRDIPIIISSDHNILHLEFYSDNSIQRTGFSAQFYADKDECSIDNGGCQHFCQNTLGSYRCSCRKGYTLHTNRHNCTETKCKFEITTAYGKISSPNYPENYPKNTYCYWHFATALGHRVQLTFHEFEIENHQECFYDFVSIHDGRSENSSTLGVYCGGNEPQNVLATTNHMFMVLQTDGNVQRSGFLASYSTVCGGYLRATNRTQVFYSHPRYDRRPYKRNSYCNWRIESDSESSVELTFLSFDIEYSDRCDYDSVEISEELYLRNHYHGKYCGNKKPPKIVSYSDTILVRFQSDDTTSLRGFAAAFIAVEPPEEEEAGESMVTPFPGYIKNIYETVS